jgi:murein tripeptide amidase MpaA
MRTIALLALAIAKPLAADPAMAPLPPALAWHGASERLVARPGDPWITPAEAANFFITPDYATTRARLEKLVAASPLLRLSVSGHTAQGRDILLVTASKDGAALDPKKPLVLVQAGIHAGEIDGKDAGLMLLRDIALRGKDKLLDHANLLFVPMFNADGHERISAFNRPNQRGPANQGWRTTAQNLNLNRDYLKADTPEMQAMLGLIVRTNPDLYLDLHVTDGIDYQYDITFGFNGYDTLYARSPAIGAWLDATYRPAVSAALTAAGHIPGRLIFAKDDRDPDAGLIANAESPRFSEGYGDLRRMGAVLVENHSLKPYKQRVLGTYVLLEATLAAANEHGDALKAAVARDRALRPAAIIASWKPKPAADAAVEFKGIAHTSYASPATGGKEIRWLGTPVRLSAVSLFHDEPDVRVTLPKAWWVPATRPDVIAKLRLHGVTVEPVAAPTTVQVDMVRLVDPKIATRANEGHIELAVGAVTRSPRRETFPAGSVRVSSDQPLGELAAMLLDPESPESLLAWGEFPEILQRTEYIEGYALAPLADRMLADPAIKAALDAKLAADPKFAASPDARLGWFYAQTPYYDDRYLLYPIGFER